MERDSDDDRIDLIKHCYRYTIRKEQYLKWMQYHKEKLAFWKAEYESNKKGEKKMDKVFHDSINRIKKPINLEEIEKEIRKEILKED